MKLRNRIPICYYEPDEPSFDEYIYCDKCCDYVYEYCSLHGPLLVVPDDTAPHSLVPSPVPRSALTIPHRFLHLAPSIIPGAGLGVFSSRALPNGVRFGPYRGVATKKVASMYCWQILSDNNKPSHFVDASDAAGANWMRYVNCARGWCEQNLVAYQYRGQIYYRTIKVIPRFTELMVFYGSEFAAALDIDLRRYYLEDYYQPADTTKNQDEESIVCDTYTHTYQDIEYEETYTNNVSSYSEYTQECVQEQEIYYKDSNNEITIQNITFLDEMPKNVEFNPVTETAGSVRKETGNPQSEKHSITPNYDSQPNPYTLPKQCPICYKTFDRLYSLKRHFLTHKTTYTSVISMTQTSQLQISTHAFTCDICGYPCETGSNLYRHKVKKHSVKKCQICSKDFTDTEDFYRHMTQHTLGKRHNCTKCRFKTDYAHIFDQHLKRHMTERFYRCDRCSFETLRRDSIVRHLKIHYKN